MESEDRNKAIKFFEEAIPKWQKFILIWNLAVREQVNNKGIAEADSILQWFQENYPVYRKCSDFTIYSSSDGKTDTIDPIFDLIFQGGNIRNLLRHHISYETEINQIGPILRGHLSSVKNPSKSTEEKSASSLEKVLRIINRFHLAAIQLKNRRKGKSPFQIEDEYDVQDMLHAFLTMEFDDIRKEEYTPSYVGATSRIDIVLRNEKILVEAKKTNENLKAKDIGDQLINDIARYEKYPQVKTLICFIYDPDFLIENPEGFKADLEKLPTKVLQVIAVICPKQ